MRHFYLPFLVCLFSLNLYGQNNVGIGTLNPNNNAALEIKSDDKGLLIPRLDAAQRAAIVGLSNIESGLLVFDQTDNLFYYWDGNVWRPMPIDLDQQNIDSVVLTGNNLEVFISNGNSANVDLGPLAAQGPQGPQGPSGADGVSIISTIDNGDGTFTFNYSDNTSFTTSDLTGPQGPQGPAGADGADGAVGPQGPQGPAGADGADGAIGPQGLQGPAGADGADGAVGPQGPQGLQGPAGADGADGAVGPQGPQGPAGADGAVGPQGPQGPAGADGAVGPQGPQGLQGPAGADGADGAVGPQGPQGPAGADGADGAIGPQGPQGPAGADGADGAVGPQGPAGIDGVSIVSTIDNGDGTFTFNYSDNTSFTTSDLTGPQGLQGPAGADGAVGPQGPQGLQGPAGADGADGAIGPQGPQGLQGPAGADGADGAVGPQGPQGLQGPAGADGADGAVGPQGPQGLQGPAGADGADGAVGPQGPQGPAGADGADGAVGPQGPQGLQGPAGADGADGAIGPQGPQGLQGPAGADGADGAVGPQGPQGPAGADGADGAVGPQGPQGLQGPAGADGADGAIGPQGPQGLQGPAGADGVDGAVGPQGPQGPAGADGVDGVSIVSTIDNGDGTFTFNYSDNTSFTTSDLTGPQGPSWTITSFDYNQDGSILLNGSAGSGLPITTTQAAWLLDGNWNGGTRGFGTNSNTSVDFETNNIVRGRFLNTGEMIWGDVAITAPAVPGDPLNSYMIYNTNNWAFNGINITAQGGAVFGSNTSPSNGYSAVEGTHDGDGIAVRGLHLGGNPSNGIGVYGYTGSNQGIAGFFAGDVVYTGALIPSDYRWKNNIKPIQSALEKIMDLEAKSYEMDTENFPGMGFTANETNYGFIAQEFQKIFPELVSEKDIPNPRATPSAKEETSWQSGYLMIDYISLVPLLTRAIQEQQELINRQEQQNLQQEQRILNLENQLLEILETIKK